ncbi:MAG: HAD-IA family hydrolase [Pirellulales bacterium]|nr:HAD-IA family hydrolase [Pirellulales bacterium]MBL7194348.1 HAD-IA family hydrolase [Pirellulales bacterium]
MRCPAFIYLDLGRVVVDFDHTLAWQKVAAITGLAEADIEQFFTADDRPRRIETGLLAWDTLHAEFVRAMAVEVDVDALARAAGDIFTLRAEMLPVIAAIERAGVPLGILSNTCDIHWQHLLRCRYGILPGGIGPLVLSYEVGAMKPHPSIYEAAVAKAGVPADRIFFCDDIPAHVEAARAAGWDAEVFTGARQLVEQLASRGVPMGL